MSEENPFFKLGAVMFNAQDKATQRESELLATIAELKGVLDMRRKADGRAMKAWRAKTGRNLTIPDHADLCVHLLEVIAELRGVLEYIDDEIHPSEIPMRELIEQALEKTKNY